MRTLLLLVLTVICVSCSHECDVTPAPAITAEQVSITWSAYSQELPMAGYVTLQVYSGTEYYEVQCTKKTFEIKLKKGDYVLISVHPTIIDQSQNESGIVCNYIISDSSGIIVQGMNNGTSFYIK